MLARLSQTPEEEEEDNGYEREATSLRRLVSLSQ